MPPSASARPPIQTTQRVPNCSSNPIVRAGVALGATTGSAIVGSETDCAASSGSGSDGGGSGSSGVGCAIDSEMGSRGCSATGAKGCWGGAAGCDAASGVDVNAARRASSAERREVQPAILFTRFQCDDQAGDGCDRQGQHQKAKEKEHRVHEKSRPRWWRPDCTSNNIPTVSGIKTGRRAANQAPAVPE